MTSYAEQLSGLSATGRYAWALCQIEIYARTQYRTPENRLAEIGKILDAVDQAEAEEPKKKKEWKKWKR